MKTSLLSIFLFFFINLSAQINYFPPIQGDEWETLSIQELGWCEDQLDELLAYLQDNDTKAFMILKDGKIVIEEYYQDMDMSTNHQWNSAGKTISALMVGIAQENGLLDIDDKTSDYLGTGWTALSTEQEDQITIRHQLSMSSGMDDSQGFCTDPECLIYLSDPETRWSYHNAPYTLLSDVVESASNQTMNTFVNQNLKIQTGMNGAYIPLGYNKIFYSTPRSMARFGSLMLNQGVWDNTTIIGDLEFYNELITPSQDLNQSYGYLWWLSGYESFMIPGSQIIFPGSLTPDAPDDLYSAMGKNGQFLDLWPSQNIAIVRMGGAPNDDLVGINFHNEMWEYISAFICDATPVSENEIIRDLKIYPNPFDEFLRIETATEIKNIRLYNTLGQIILEKENATEISGKALSAGVYWLELENRTGQKTIKKIIKN